MNDAGTEAAQWLRAVPLAHRGLHSPGVPENSLAAFEAACAAGIGIELDVRLSSDGVPMVCHDLDLLRITGAAGRLDQHDLKALTGMRLVDSDEGLPTLDQALRLIAGRVPVMVEVKNEGTRVGAVEGATAAILAAHHGPQVVASFNPLTIRWFARTSPHVARVLTGGASDVVPAVARRLLRSMLRRHMGDPVGLSWNVQRLDDPIVLAARAADVPVVAWTVRTSQDLVRARDGADQVIFEGVSLDEVRASA